MQILLATSTTSDSGLENSSHDGSEAVADRRCNAHARDPKLVPNKHTRSKVRAESPEISVR